MARQLRALATKALGSVPSYKKKNKRKKRKKKKEHLLLLQKAWIWFPEPYIRCLTTAFKSRSNRSNAPFGLPGHLNGNAQAYTQIKNKIHLKKNRQ